MPPFSQASRISHQGHAIVPSQSLEHAFPTGEDGVALKGTKTGSWFGKKIDITMFVALQSPTLSDKTPFLGMCYGLNCAAQRAVTPTVTLSGERAFRR